jgi:hypothetical protein
VDVHFLYVTRNRRDPQMGVENPAILNDVQMAESSSPIYRVFREIAAATGGTSQASANPVALLRKAAEASSLFGKAWVRERDGAVLKIEWEPGSMRNYAAIEEFAKASRAQPRIRFSSEYGFEKNGLRFPSVYGVIEAYRTSGRTVTHSRTSVVYKDYKFFEVKVRTEVRRAG